MARRPAPLCDASSKIARLERENGKIVKSRSYRHGGKVFPLEKTGLDGEKEGRLEETTAAIAGFWQNELVKAEAFIEARMEYYNNEATGDDLQWLDYLRRPSLSDVLQALESFGDEHKL